MGATLSTESVLTAAVVAGALGVGYHQYTSESTPVTNVPKKKKKKKGPEDKHSAPTPSQSTPLVDSSSSIPGQFHDPTTSASSKTKKSKKNKHALRPNPPPPLETSVQHSQVLQEVATSSIDTDGSWTRVKSRRGQGSEQTTNDVMTTSDAGITSSVTEENSSPVDDEEGEEESLANKPQTLAEMLVPKAPKTVVDDMLPPQPTPSRVMRIQPLPNEKPLSGFSWGDYEDVQVADGGGEDADGEDDGWGVVQSKRSRASKREPSAVAQQQRPVETLTRKQRQNAKRRETQKAVKAATEAERVATLANHKRELERIRMMEQSRSSRGMTPVVDDRGKLVWE